MRPLLTEHREGGGGYRLLKFWTKSAQTTSVRTYLVAWCQKPILLLGAKTSSCDLKIMLSNQSTKLKFSCYHIKILLHNSEAGV
jgi:hypothetical protein